MALEIFWRLILWQNLVRNVVCTLPLHCLRSNLEGTDYIIVSSISKAVVCSRAVM